MFETANVSIKPPYDLPEGRYLLDSEGRLFTPRYSGFIKAVCNVIVTHKPEIAQSVDPAPSVAPKHEKISPPPRPADPPKREEIFRPMARRSKPTPVQKVPADDDVVLESIERRAPATRAEAIKLAAKIDTKALASAYRLKSASAPKAKPKAAPTKVAMSPDPCGSCGASGRHGCEHQLPMEAR